MYLKDITVQKIKAQTDCSSKFIEINGQEVHYKDEGEGPAIILLHGIAGSLFIWDKWTHNLKKHYRVIRPDLPAFGLTGKPNGNDFSMEYYSKFVIDFANSLGLNHFFIGGHSTGGQIAYETAAQIPDRVLALALIAPTGFSKINNNALSATFRLAFKTFGKEHITWITSRYLLKKHLKQLYYNQEMVTDALIDKYLNNLLREGNRQSFFDFLNKNHRISSTKIGEVITPTLIQWGEADKIIPVSDASKFKSIITNIRLITYPEVGHFPFDELDGKSCVDLISFLEDFNYIPNYANYA